MTDFINDGTTLNAAKADLIPIGNSDPTKFVAATDWNQLRQALLDIQTYALTDHRVFDVADKTKYALLEAYNGNPNGVLTRRKGSVVYDYTTPAIYQNQNGLATWAAVGGGGGYSGAWAAGTYSAGKIVKRGNFVFGCESTTSVDPCNDFGDVTNASFWNWNGFSAPNPALGWATLIASVNSQAHNMVSKLTGTDFLTRRLIIDAQVVGSADALGFGIYDASLTQTPTGSIGSFAGSWGVELDIFNSRAISYVNGVGGVTPVSTNSFANDQLSNNFKRYYLDFINQGGGLMTMTIWHQPNAGRVSGSGSSPMKAITDDLQFVATFPGITIPTLSSGWRFIATARTGGSNADFKVKLCQAIYTGAEWSVLSQIPQYNIQRA